MYIILKKGSNNEGNMYVKDQSEFFLFLYIPLYKMYQATVFYNVSRLILLSAPHTYISI